MRIFACIFASLGQNRTIRRYTVFCEIVFANILRILSCRIRSPRVLNWNIHKAGGGPRTKLQQGDTYTARCTRSRPDQSLLPGPIVYVVLSWSFTFCNPSTQLGTRNLVATPESFRQRLYFQRSMLPIWGEKHPQVRGCMRQCREQCPVIHFVR